MLNNIYCGITDQQASDFGSKTCSGTHPSESARSTFMQFILYSNKL